MAELLGKIIAVAMVCASIAHAQAPPLVAYGALPDVTDVTLSRDGRMLAWLSYREDAQYVTMHEIATKQAKRVFSIPNNYSVRALRWFDEETLLVDVSSYRETRTNIVYRDEVFRVLAFDVSGGAGRVLLMKDSDHEWMNRAIIVRPHLARPKTLLMWTLELSNTVGQGRYVPTLFEVDVTDGRGKIIARGSPRTMDWAADYDGRPRARADYSLSEGIYSVLTVDASGTWREVYQQQGEALAFCGMSSDGRDVYALGTRPGDAHQKLWAVALDGSGIRPILGDAARDVDVAVVDPMTDDAIGGIFGGISPETQWFNPAAAARAKALAKAFAGRNVSVVSRSSDFKKVIVYADGPSHPGAYFLVDFATGKADMVGEEYPLLANVPQGVVETLTYKARDGYSVPAYVTWPDRIARDKLPLVVLPHGGPESRDTLQFDWLSQFLASRGYAVLRPQFRGSTGFGAAHRTAGYRQWGRLMQDDVTDGVTHLIATGAIDAARICIVGASYGGYAALAGAAFTPNLYRCAASINGVADLPVMIGQLKKQVGANSGRYAYWENHIGSPFDQAVIDASPARAAERIRVPILLMHAENDTIVHALQSEAMARALAEANKPHSLVKFDGEDHWLSRGTSRLRVLTELEKFLGLNLRRQ